MVLNFFLNILTFGLYSKMIPLGFQTPNSIAFNNIIDFHDYIIIFLIFIFIIVMWHLIWACNLFNLFSYFVFYYDLYQYLKTSYKFYFTLFKKNGNLTLFYQDLENESNLNTLIFFIKNDCSLDFLQINQDYFWECLVEIVFFNPKRNNNFILRFIYELMVCFFSFFLFIGFLNKKGFLSETSLVVYKMHVFTLQEHIKKEKYETKFLTHATGLEIFWTIFPSFILLAIAVPSLILLYQLDAVEPLSLCIKVIGHQWYWTYEIGSSVGLFQDFLPGRKVNYPTSFDSYMITDGAANLRLLEVDNPLFVPAGIPLTFLITSADVIHSWAVPSLGIKVDAIPGRLNQVCVTILDQGVFYGQCSELCGVNHGFMPINIIAY